MIIGSWKLTLTANPRNDHRDGIYRGVWMISLSRIISKKHPERREFAIQLQYHPEGFHLKPHVDGYASQKNLWILLKPAQEGGELRVEGPVKSWLWGRVRYYNGSDLHWLTKIKKGSRLLLILYSARGRWQS